MRHEKLVIIGAVALIGAIIIIGVTGLRVAHDPADLNATASSASTADGAALLPGTVEGGDRAMLPAAAGADPVVAMQEQRNSAAVEAQPPQTYIGPDGKEYQIAYNQGLRLTDQQQAQARKAILDDMKRHPEAFAQVYGMELEEVQLIVQGKREFPHRIMNELVRQ